MNAGVISSRYSLALLKLVQETGAGEKTYSQACTLVQRMQEVDHLAEVLHKHPEISLDRKMQLIDSALEEPQTEDLRRFVRLVHTNGRMEFLMRMLQSFTDRYREAKGLKVGRLVTALPIPGLEDKLKQVVLEKTGFDLILEESIDPDIIGGFILEVEDLRMDASVEAQFRRLRRELIDNNNRIV